MAGLLAGLSFVLLAGGPAFGQEAGAVRYVDADAAAGGDGTSWADAFRDLQDALAVAAPGDEVWVAEGTYRPTTGSDRTATFTLRSGVAIYGGFDGTEASRDERDWTANETILSGDVGVSGDSTDNAYHVVTASGVDATAVLDGLTIEQGRASAATAPHDRGSGLLAIEGSPSIRNGRFFRNTIGLPIGGQKLGGGIYVEDGSPLIEDTVFEENGANYGGALYASNSSPVLRRVTFVANGGTGVAAFVAGSAGVVEDALFEQNEGQAAYIEASNPVFRRTTFRDNVLPISGAGTIGAGVYIREGAPRFEDCLFDNLRTNFDLSGEGGGVYVDDGSEPSRPVFLRSTFRDNTANTGGAAYVEDSPALFLLCHFERNTALAGGALHVRRAAATVLASTFVGNRAEPGQTSGLGGGLDLGGVPEPGARSLVASTLFAGNTARKGGGALVGTLGASEARLVNVTLAGNVASEAGGGLWHSDAPGVRVENAVFWGNAAPTGPEVHVASGVGPTVARAIVEGGCPAGAICTDVTGADPLFVREPSAGPDGRWGTSDDDYGDLRVQAGSPALDAGLTSFLPPDVWDLDADGDTTEVLPLDLAGEARVQGEEVDLGAYEGAASLLPAVTVQAPSAEGLVIVPASGGAFEFRVTLTNAGSEAQTVDAGTAVYLPNGTLYGPLVARTVTVPAGSSVTATLSQRVPGSAPGGLYRYVVYTGAYPDLAQSDTFGFLKEAAVAASARVGSSVEEAWGVEVLAVEEAPGDPQAVSTLLDLPADYALGSAYPNPFTGQTTMPFALPEDARVRVEVYDLLGRRVATLADGLTEAGRHAVVLDVRQVGLASGVYVVRAVMEAESSGTLQVFTQRVTLLR